MFNCLDIITTLPILLQFFTYLGIISTGLIVLYMVVWIHNLAHPSSPECPDWADPEKWNEFLAYDQEMKKRKWWE